MRPQLVSGGNHMADMLVKLYNIPHSHDIEESLLKSVLHVMRRQAEIFSALWLCWKVKEKKV